MNRFSYETHGINTYLVYTLQFNEVVDTMSLGMITNNRIPGLAQTLFTQVDSTKYIKYNVSAKVTVTDFFTGMINRKRLLGVFGGIVDAMISAEEYMVDAGTIILDTDFIFTDVSTCETSLICLPLLDQYNQPPDMVSFFRNIMFTHQFDQTENCDYIAPIINYLNSTPVFSLYDFKKLLDSLKANAPGGARGKSYAQQPTVSEQKLVQHHVVEAPVQTMIVSQPVVQQPAVQKPMVQQPVVQQSVQQEQGIYVTPGKVKAFHEVFGNGPAKSEIPPTGRQSQPQPEVETPVDTGEKMTLFKLLSKYNKENAALYKAQKAAQKAAKNSGASAPSEKKEKKAKAHATAPQTSFAVPGQPTSPSSSKVGFAIPGQSAPAPAAKTDFVVPGKPATAPTTGGFRVPSAPPVASAPQTSQVQSHATPVIPVIESRPSSTQGPQFQMPKDFGETTVLGGGYIDETTVLGASTSNTPQLNPYLLREKNDERILINKPLFRLGKERSFVDYFIGDNSAISRSHANIIRQGDDFYIVDANSTNHTYVNNVMISSGVEHPLKHGDKIRLANEEFVFNIY